MRMLTFGRIVAALLSVGTFAFLFVNDSWHAENAFLVPDLILCAVLAVAAALPARSAAPALAIAFAYSAGVLSCAVAADAVRGSFNVAGLFGAVTAAVMAILLSLPARRG